MDYQSNEKYAKNIGRILDNRYTLMKVIGEGSSAVVFQADDMRTGRPVAVKILKPEHSSDIKAVKRFENECKVISMLSHSSIVRVVDVSVNNSPKYIVMEYINGITLRQYMDGRGALPFSDIMEFGEQILSALEHAHSKGIIHRDIKPQNIMLLPKGHVKITDFGIAQVNDDTMSLVSDAAAGTAYYISPEQAAGGEVDARSDIYSLGVVMYEMATGQLPFDGDDPVEIAKKQITATPIPPSEINPDIPKGLEAMILMAMEKMPDARFKDAGEMLKYLYKIKSRPNAVPRISEKRKKTHKKIVREDAKPSRSMTPVVWGVACAMLLLAIIAGYYVFSSLFFADKEILVSKEVPDFVGSIYTEGKMEYDQKYFSINVDGIIFKYDDTTEPYTIIEQSPKGGSLQKVIANSQKCEITLTVSLGAKYNVMEDYSLMDSRTAALILRQKGYKLNIVEEYNPMVPTGQVISTVPSVGESVLEGSEITLKVSTGYQYENMVIPNFAGLTEVAATKIINEKGLKVGKVIYTRSGEDVGVILTQSIEADSAFGYTNVKIDFVVSGGVDYPTKYIPSVIGLDRMAAQVLLWKFGITVERFTMSKSNEPENTVIVQDPSATGEIPPDCKSVKLTVSGGPEYKPSWIVVRVPNVMNETLDNAMVILTNSYCAVGEVTYAQSDLPAGTIISQSREPGSLCSGYPYEVYVNLIISNGDAPVTDAGEATDSPEETDPSVSTASPTETTQP